MLCPEELRQGWRAAKKLLNSTRLWVRNDSVYRRRQKFQTFQKFHELRGPHAKRPMCPLRPSYMDWSPSPAHCIQPSDSRTGVICVYCLKSAMCCNQRDRQVVLRLYVESLKTKISGFEGCRHASTERAESECDGEILSACSRLK